MAEQSSSLSSPNVPPPPAEVKVRTMRSDIDGIAKSGGGSPQFKTVPVEGMDLAKSRVGYGASGEIAISDQKNGFPWWIAVIGIIAVAAILWFGYVLFIAKK